MKRKLHPVCIDCGSEVQNVTIDEVKPVYREEIIHYACGAVLRSMSASRGQKGKVSHEGCGSENISNPESRESGEQAR